jgi:hypothetical protein
MEGQSLSPGGCAGGRCGRLDGDVASRPRVQ